jgi:uroporphyrinogen III methyltransferase/synthase
MPGQFAAEALADVLGNVQAQRVLLLNADIAKPTLHNRLMAAGAKVDRVIAYRTIGVNPTGVDVPTMLTSGGVDAILFTSGSIAQHFVEQLDQRALDVARTRIIACIGPATAEAATELGLLPTAVATTATEQGLIEALIAAARTQPEKHEFLP